MTSSSQLDAVTLLARVDAAGLYQADEEAARVAFNAATPLGYNAYRIDLGLATDKHSLLSLFARSLHFPDWFGDNWDAAAECLTDLSWEEADGYMLILQRVEALRKFDARTLDTFYDVLREAADVWRQDGTPFWVLIVDENDNGLPRLTISS
ncbi:MAG: barstar family protein [Rhodocyclaceae bacterium]